MFVIRSRILTVVALATASTASAGGALLPADVDHPLVRQAWPAVMEHCPGLRRFRHDLTFSGLEDRLDPLWGDMARLDIVFDVAQNARTIPREFMAAGHRCRYGIGPEGNTLRIQKNVCVSVCLGRQAPHSSADYVTRLVAE